MMYTGWNIPLYKLMIILGENVCGDENIDNLIVKVGALPCQ